MTMIKNTLRFLIIFLCINLQGKSQSLELFRDHQTSFRIVIPEKPSENELIAARIMASYLQKVSDAEFLILSDTYPESDHEILIGLTNRTKLLLNEETIRKITPSGYYITRENGKLIIAGGS